MAVLESGISAGQKSERQSASSEVIELLEKFINSLDSTVLQLNDRLVRVCGQENPPSEVKSEPASSMPDYFSRIRELVWLGENSRDKIEDIISRLEL